MTPMLDIVFIMLIFFIVSAVFLNEKGIDFTQSNGGDGHPTDESISVYVFADGSASINGQLTDVSTVPTRIKIIRAARPRESVSIRSAYSTPFESVVFLEDQFAMADIPTSLRIDTVE